VVEIKPAEADRFLAKPDPAIRVVLVHGEEGLVAERTAAFVKAVIGSADDPFAHVRLEADELASDPGRLSDEAHAIPLFGGRRAISLRISGSRSIIPAIEAVLAIPPLDSWIVISAADLRKTSPLRRLAENHKSAALIACFADSSRDLERLIDEEIGTAGLAIDGEARGALVQLIGGDRLLSRGEIRKLCIYATDKRSITIEDVRAIVGDASAFDLDDAIDAIALGDVAAFTDIYRRLVASGTPGFVIAGAVLRHFSFLHRARATVDRGGAVDAAIAQRMPPLFYKRRALVEREIALWPVGRIERALANVDQAIVDSRLRSAIADEVIGQTLGLLAAVGASLRRS
jgi:DNA polymerase-3 subunit delta